MAHAWIPEETACDAGNGGRDMDPRWAVRQLTGECEAFGAASLVRGGTTDGGNRAVNDDNWAVIGPASVRVNGDPLHLGIRVLTDKDEIRVGGEPAWFFSTERFAQIEPFPGRDRVTHCARCKLPIEPGSPAVCCPVCGLWYHQIGSDPSVKGNLPCWTYDEACASCLRTNELDAGYQWTPEDL